MSAAKPRVSIGLPVYNGERYLKEAVDSILAQTLTDFELIISDNASTDGTQALAEAYAARDPRVHYYRNDRNLGATRNYNRTFDLARGEHFKWAAHDDVCAPEFLKRCVEALDRHPAVVLAYPRTIVIDEAGQPLRDDPIGLNLRAANPAQRYSDYHRRFRQSRACNPVFGLMRAEALRRTPLIGSYVASDEVLLAALVLLGEFYEVPEQLFFRRDHAQASTRAYRFTERMAWFDPNHQGRVHLPRLRWLKEQARVIARSHLKVIDKARCYGELLGWAVWKRRRIMEDLVTGGWFLARQLPDFVQSPLRLAWRRRRR